MSATPCLARCLRAWRCWRASTRCLWTTRAGPCKTYGEEPGASPLSPGPYFQANQGLHIVPCGLNIGLCRENSKEPQGNRVGLGAVCQHLATVTAHQQVAKSGGQVKGSVLCVHDGVHSILEAAAGDAHLVGILLAHCVGAKAWQSFSGCYNTLSQTSTPLQISLAPAPSSNKTAS